MTSPAAQAASPTAAPVMPAIPPLHGIPFTPTIEQANVVRSVVDGHDVVVQAGAGAGKSVTLAMIASAIQTIRPTATVRYITFNKRNAVEVSELFESYGLRNAMASTAHSMAYRAVRDNPNLRHIIDRLNAVSNRKMVDDFVYLHAYTLALEYPGARATIERALKYNKRDFSWFEDLPEDKRGNWVKFEWAKAVLLLAHGTVKRFTESPDPTIERKHVPSHDLTRHAPKPLPTDDEERTQEVWDARNALADTVVECARRIWMDQTMPGGVLKVSHATYVKAWALTNPTVGRWGDVLLYDEAQDANPLLFHVVVAQRGHNQLALVGDQFQAINGFMGAEDAMPAFAALPGVQELPLSETRRFGPLAAGYANRILDLLDPEGRSPMRLIGKGSLESEVVEIGARTQPEEVQAVVCRSNGSVVNNVLEQVRLGKRVYTTLDFDELISLAADVRRVLDGRADQAENAALRRFLDPLDFRAWLDSPDPNEAYLHGQVQLARRFGAEELASVAAKVVRKQGRTEPVIGRDYDVLVSTIHKAKGGTWDNVLVEMMPAEYDDDGQPLMFNPVDKDTSEDELRLFYVAVTRARYITYTRTALAD